MASGNSHEAAARAYCVIRSGVILDKKPVIIRYRQRFFAKKTYLMLLMLACLVVLQMAHDFILPFNRS